MPWSQCYYVHTCDLDSILSCSLEPNLAPCTRWPVKAFPTEVGPYTLEEVTVPSNV